MTERHLFVSLLGAILAMGQFSAPAAEESTESTTPTTTQASPVQLVATQTVQFKPLQSILDERRDRLQQRREQRLQRFIGRHGFAGPWDLAMHDRMDLLRDHARAVHRQQRDWARWHRDAGRVFMSPLARFWRDQAEIRSYNSQMAQLDRMEAMENLAELRPYGLFW